MYCGASAVLSLPRPCLGLGVPDPAGLVGAGLLEVDGGASCICLTCMCCAWPAQAVLVGPAGSGQRGGVHQERLLQHRPGGRRGDHEHQPHGLGRRRQPQGRRQPERPGLPAAHGCALSPLGWRALARVLGLFSGCLKQTTSLVHCSTHACVRSFNLYGGTSALELHCGPQKQHQHCPSV